MRNFIKTGSFAILALIVVTYAWAAATPTKFPTDVIQWGKSGSTLNKSLNFDFGLGASNPLLGVDNATKSLNYSKNTFNLGDGASSNKVITANTGASPAPAMRWNSAQSAWEFSNDGTNFNGIGSGSGGGGGVQYLTNGDFETGTSATGWTITTVAGSNSTSNVYQGKNAELLTYSGTTGSLAQSLTPTQTYVNINLEASCKVYTTMSTIEVCGLNAGVKQNCQAVPATGSWSYVAAAFSVASGTIGVQVDTTSSGSGTVYVDDCYVGPSRLIGTSNTLTGWRNDLTWSFTAAGTVTNNVVYYRRIGDSMEVQGNFTSTSATGSTFELNLPTGYTIDSTKLNSSNGGTLLGTMLAISSGSNAITVSNQFSYLFYDGSTTAGVFASQATNGSVMVKSIGSAVLNSGQQTTFHFVIPIAQFVDQSVYKIDGTPANWSGNTSVSGGCSVTSASYGDTSTCTGITLTSVSNTNMGSVTTASGSLPGITFTAPRTGLYRVCGTALIALNNTGNIISARLTDGSNNVLNPGMSVGGVSTNFPNVFPLCETSMVTSGSPFTVKFQVATSGNTSSIQNGQATGTPAINWEILETTTPVSTPLLMGSVVSTTLGVEHIERAIFTQTSGGCTITSQSGGWITGASRTGTANCVVTINAGEFSATPTCTIGNNASGLIFQPTPTTSGFTLFGFNTATNTGQEGYTANVICMGPR